MASTSSTLANENSTTNSIQEIEDSEPVTDDSGVERVLVENTTDRIVLQSYT